MNYFYINGVDYSNIVSSLSVKNNAVYNSLTNAAGNTVVDYVNSKRSIEVEIIPLNDTKMLNLLSAIAPFNVSISFRNPHTNMLEENVNCIIPSTDVDYYTIQVNKVMYKTIKLKFTEL